MKKLLLSLFILSAIGCEKENKVNSEPVLNDTANILARGVNLSNWFNDYSDPTQYGTRFPPATLQLIKSNGFTYVRLPIGVTILFNAAEPAVLKSGNLTYVEAAIDNCINAGLGVMINLHPWTNNTDSLLANDPSFVNKLALYWQALAVYFKKYPADKLFFEIYNEPHASAVNLTTQSYQWWQPVQEQMIANIRAVDTVHTIIAGGEGWNSIDGLTQLVPYNYKNIVYTFHFYEPFLFTHQGASWAGWQPAIDARNVPYPSSPAAVAPLITASNNTSLNDVLRWYGEQRYNIDSLDKWIRKAYDWGKSHNVTVICNEFGSYKTYAPRHSRLNFLTDARTTFEKYGIGWAMWDCDEGFGWIEYPSGNRNFPTADREVLKALGLK
ncbi:glycoside hydrolase family 5 protein [soil metagenome]